MSTQYTPGPWIDKNKDIPFAGGDIYAKGEYICTTSGNAKANTALICAAPELLECLIEWLEMSGVDPFQPNSQGYSKQTVKAINAIQKATGGVK